MCSWIRLRATDSKGKRRKDIPELTFEVPDHFTPEYPTCTCWIADKEGDGKTLRHTFADTVLQEMLSKVNYGNIVIEIR